MDDAPGSAELANGVSSSTNPFQNSSASSAPSSGLADVLSDRDCRGLVVTCRVSSDLDCCGTELTCVSSAPGIKASLAKRFRLFSFLCCRFRCLFSSPSCLLVGGGTHLSLSCCDSCNLVLLALWRPSFMFLSLSSGCKSTTAISKGAPICPSADATAEAWSCWHCHSLMVSSLSSGCESRTAIRKEKPL